MCIIYIKVINNIKRTVTLTYSLAMQLIAVAYKKNNESNVSDGMSQMITDITHSNCMNMFDIVKNLKTLTHPWKSNKSGLRA